MTYEDLVILYCQNEVNPPGETPVPGEVTDNDDDDNDDDADEDEVEDEDDDDNDD